MDADAEAEELEELKGRAAAEHVSGMVTGR